MDNAVKRVLVAGGAGFLGSHLCEALLGEGMEVVCLDNLMTGRMENLKRAIAMPGFSFVKHDIVEPLPESVTSQKFAEIYNLACPASPPAYQEDPTHTMMTNVVGTKHLLELAELNRARFLLTSTSEIYGDPLEHPQQEDYRGNVNPIGPRACYDEGKRAAETLCFDFDRERRVEVRVARIFNTYGPRLSGEDGRVVSNFIVQALGGEALTIYGSGEQTRSFCYVSDQIRGLRLLARYDGEQPGPINIGNPNEITVLELATTILKLTNSHTDLQKKPLPVDDPRRRRPNIKKAGDFLRWEPEVSLAEGLRQTIDWFKDQKEVAA